jgi:hypothetical protein
MNNDLQFVIKAKEFIYKPVFIKNNLITNLNMTGKLINYKGININNFYKWFSNEGGINLEKFKLDINQTKIIGSAFFGLDKNLNIQSSISFTSTNLYKLFLILENKNFITKNTLKTSNFIIKAIEISSAASNKVPNYSISIQNGYLSLMGIKLINIPNLEIKKID